MVLRRGCPLFAKPSPAKWAAARNVAVTPEEVVVVPGGKPDPLLYHPGSGWGGDEVIYPNPSFPIYESMIEFVAAFPSLRLREERDFRLDVNELAAKITPRNPSDHSQLSSEPTGGVLTEQDIRGVVAAIATPTSCCSPDEIYSRLIFEGSHFSPISIPSFRERTILLDGFLEDLCHDRLASRLRVMRTDLAAQIARLMTNSNSCTASFTQRAGVAALTATRRRLRACARPSASGGI